MSSFTLLFCTILASATAFQGSSVLSLQLKNQGTWKIPESQPRMRTSTALEVAWALDSSDDIHDFYARARECAFSDENGGECSLDDASDLLQDLTVLLSKCGMGNLGADNEVCEDQDVAAEIVAKLRVIASPTASGADVAQAPEESVWKAAWWAVLTDFEIPVAITFYFLCIFCMIQFGEFGVNQIDFQDPNAVNEYYMSATDLPPAVLHHVNQIDFQETNAKVNEYYMSATHLPPAFLFHRMF